MIDVIQDNDLYIIKFRYDPILISLIKQIAGRKWDPENKVWTIPKDKLGFLIKLLSDTPYASQLNITSNEDINVNAKIEPTYVIPKIDISKIPFYVKPGAKPYQHQLDFMKYAIDRQQKGIKTGFILGDDAGLGKSLQICNLAIYNRKQYKFKHCLIICCINSSKYNWVEDIEEHTRNKFQPYILGTRLRRDKTTPRYDTGSKEKLDDLISGHMYGNLDAPKLPYFIIMNIEAIRFKQGRKYLIADKLIELINKGEISMIAIDEIHKNASPTSMQGKQLSRIYKHLETPIMWIPLTGTPISNRPTDLFLPLRLIGAHQFTNYSKWCNEFCIYGGYGGYEIIGYKNIPKLKKMLQSNMLRRLKKDVLDLPDKIQINEYVENTPFQKKLYSIVAEEIENEKADILMSSNPMTKFLRLRQVNGAPELVDTSIKIDNSYLSKNAKIQKVLDKLVEIHERNEKVVIFSNWVEPLRTLYRFVSKKYNVCTFTGTMTEADKLKNKEIFLTNPKYTVLLGTIGAMGVSHTFTVANNLIFLDEPWNPTDKLQAEERIYRIGTNRAVNIYTILTKDTVDDKVHKILYKKGTISDYIIDNKLDIKKDPKLFNYLLGR